MKRPHAFAATFLAVLVLVGSTAAATNGRPSTPVTIEASDPSQTEMAERAVDRFAQAGLKLPPLRIVFPGRDLSLCGGAQGRAYLSAEPVEVRMCWNSEFTLLHELAHVWEAFNMAASRHEPFMNMREGVASWAGLGVAWESRGREHAANVIGWGLLEDPHPISRTYPNDIASMIEAFTFLTGRAPLHDGGEGIQHPDRTLFDGTASAPIRSGR
ncbi:MAG: hypothetical protein DWP92_07145 [Armatimonadetes bacterium]|nr:MAG: hypothetical protein DWP92_07145 [Armatimonadota bacterium]